MIRVAGAHLLVAGVILRALVVYADQPERDLVLGLLALYVAMLLLGPWILRRRQARAWAAGYLLLGSLPAIGLLSLPETEDFFAGLFIPLSLDASYYLNRRPAMLALGAFSVAITGSLMASNYGPLYAAAMAILYSGLCLLFGGYAHRVRRAEQAQARNRRLIAELEGAQARLQAYVSQSEEISAEQERGRLARELHDSVTQTMFSMNLTVQSARLLLPAQPARAEAQLARLEELATDAMGEIHDLVSRLRPALPSAEGLPATLRRLAAERPARDGLDVQLQVRGDRWLPESVAGGLAAIAQEALNNVARHAGTGQAFVRLQLEDGQGCLEIEDYGRGFDPGAAQAERGHLGLAGMAERAREIGWELAIEAGLGRGTRVRVREQTPEAEEGMA
jgi:signal transduction histidine kinase